VWHGGRDLLPCRSAAGSWRRAAPPCRQKCYPTAVPHGDMDLTPWGTTPYVLEIFDAAIYFLKIKTK
jgi:hypothetical protein